jgi:hypothetical protein
MPTTRSSTHASPVWWTPRPVSCSAAPTNRPFTACTSRGYPQHLKAWRQGTRLVLVEATLPKLSGSLDELTSDLDEPAARLDYSWDVLRVPKGARIYPERGIALFICPEQQLLRLSLFASCELADYLATRHYDNRLVERLLRKS